MNNTIEFWDIVTVLQVEAIGAERAIEMKNTTLGFEVLCSIDQEISILLEENNHMVSNVNGKLIIENPQYKEFIRKQIREIVDTQIENWEYEEFIKDLKDGNLPVDFESIAEQVFFQVVDKYQFDFMWELNDFEEVSKGNYTDTLQGIDISLKITDEIEELLRSNYHVFEFSGEFTDVYYKNGIKFKTEADNIKIFNAVAEIIRENIKKFYYTKEN